MSPHLALLILASAFGVLGVLVATDRGEHADPIHSGVRRVPDSERSVRLLGGLFAGAIVVSFSGWLAPAVVVGVGTWTAVRTWQRRDRRGDDVARTDALASWIENLRDVLVAGDQPIGAITATVPSCHASIRPQVRRLAAGLGRQDADVVLRRFADDIDDPLGDLVAAGLLIAIQRGARTVAVLTSLAEQARHHSDRRRLVDAERAPVQREVTLLTVIMGCLIVGLLVFGRAEYLRPYDTAGGQLFLAAVLSIYATLLLRVQQLAKYPRPRRFLTGDAPRTRECAPMRDIGFVVLAGLAAYGSAMLLVTGWRQPRPTLARQIRHNRRAPVADATDVGGTSPLTTRLGRALLGPPAGDDQTVAARTSTLSAVVGERAAAWRPSLRLLGRDPATHLGMLAMASIAGIAVPSVLLALLQTVGVISVAVWVPAGVSLAVALIVPAAIHADAMSRSADRRIDVRHQLSAYLDMVTMLLAGNTGHEGALGQAARAGDGLLFRELRRRMREVATVGDSLVRALSLVGEDFGVIELEQVADTAALSAAEGAPVARTLAAKCSTLRSTLSAEQEASARLRTDKVTPPLVGMALLFMALIIYPALTVT